LIKKKVPSTANVHHDGVVPMIRQALRVNSSKYDTKTKYKGVDIVGDEGSSLTNWMKIIATKLRI
jgi:hypothetical protein